MGSRRILGSIAIAAIFLAAPSAALATPSAAQRETARRLMDEGKERTRVGDKERALEAYRKANDLMKVPTTGVALVRAHLALGHLVEARDVALEVGRLPRDSSDPPVFEKARKEAREIESNLKPRIPTVRIIVKGGPATRVAVDEGEVASLLLGEPVALDPGRHRVSAKNADGVEKHVDIDLAERDGKEVELALPVPNPAVLVAPPPDKSNDGPSHAGNGGDHPSTERTSAANVLVFGGFGLAIVGLGVGGITGALTLSKASTVKEQCANNICDPAAKGDLDGASSLATISTIGFAVAGAGAVLGVVGLLLPRTKTESALPSSDRRAQVWAFPGGMGVRGSF